MEHQTEIPYKEVVGHIKKLRDEIISGLMADDILVDYMRLTHKVINPTPVRLEFIKKSLHDLKQSELDLVHYGKLILRLRHDKVRIPDPSESGEKFVHDDIIRSIKNHIL